jgi:Protein of unknown function (DUF3467)
MANEEQLTTKEVTDLTIVRSETFVDVYANYVSFAASASDMTIMFGKTQADDPRNPRLEQRVSVSLSPQTAKIMAHIVLRNIQSYEAQYGEIQVSPIRQQTEEPSA